MWFNSLQFWLYFSLTFAIYCLLDRKKQNILLLLASYYFYFTVAGGFVFLLGFTTMLDFWCGRRIAATEKHSQRRALLALSVVSNLVVLLLFKYVGFFAALASAFSSGHYLEVAAPIGISFYILQSMSYVVDVFRRDSVPHHSLREYALYISLFPQLLAGPIERAGRMLPQFALARKVDAEGIRAGLWLCFWGLVQKCVVADNLQARIITPYMQNPGEANGLASLVMIWCCCVRIYADFDGYSNMARGIARMMGFDLSANFHLPFYSTNSADFWRRFHITFFRWMKDYLYVPLVKNLRVPSALAVVAVFVFSALWHEVRWTFVCWGVWEACTVLGSQLFLRGPGQALQNLRGLPKWTAAISGIALVRLSRCLGVAFFVAGTVSQALGWLEPVANPSTWHFSARVGEMLLLYFFFVVPLWLVEMVQLPTGDLLAPLKLNAWKFGALVGTLLLFLMVYGVTGAQKFVYFQY